MGQNFVNYLKRFKNPGTVVATVSAILLVATTLGFKVDNDQIMYAVKIVCSLGIALGVMNNPETSGIDLPTK